MKVARPLLLFGIVGRCVALALSLVALSGPHVNTSATFLVTPRPGAPRAPFAVFFGIFYAAIPHVIVFTIFTLADESEPNIRYIIWTFL